MIIKHVDNPHRRSTKAARIGGLVDYLVKADEEEGEKVEATFTSGEFLAASWQAQRAEMIALAIEATRSDDPVDHWVLSWKEGEQPTHEQCKEAVGILRRHLGLRRSHLIMCALHCNTENYHLHVVINRVNPQTLRVADKGWHIDKAHRGLAEMVRVQGWEPEPNALYGERNNQSEDLSTQSRKRGPSSRARDQENATGIMSCERTAIDRAAPILGRAQSWKEVHAELAQIGMRYEPKGSGAVVWVGEQPVKASVVGRECSRSWMEQRLGAFEANGNEIVETRAEPHGMDGVEIKQQFMKYRRLEDDRRQRKDTALRAQRDKHQRDRSALFSDFKRERADLYREGNWKGPALNVARSLLALDHARRRAALVDTHRREREELQLKFGNRITFERFLVAAGEEGLSAEWRYRNSTLPRVTLWGDKDESEIHDIRDFVAQVRPGTAKSFSAIDYRHSGGNAQAAFTDRGKRIDVWQSGDEATVLAALQLASQKWSVINVTGPMEFRRICAELAVKHGFRISYPEMRVPTSLSRETAMEEQDPYRAHRTDILRYVKVRNPSHLDWMISIRLRVTGHDQASIANILESNAPVGRDSEVRDWSRYAKRTAAAAFGMRGDRELESNACRASVWMRVEGREPRAINRENVIENVRSRREKVRARPDLGLE